MFSPLFTQQLIRELAASSEDGQTYLPMNDYEIVVLTGDRHGAGTNVRTTSFLVALHRFSLSLSNANAACTEQRHAANLRREGRLWCAAARQLGRQL